MTAKWYINLSRWGYYSRMKNAKGWHWNPIEAQWEWFGEEEDDLNIRALHSNNTTSPMLEKDMAIEILTENNGWAIIWLHEKYFIKHLDCGTVLRQNAKNGCRCQQKIKYDCKCDRKNHKCQKAECRTEPILIPVDPIIYGKFRLMTLRDPELKEK